MRIVEVEFVLDAPQGGWENLDPTPRSPGLHVSHIIKSLYNRLYPGKREAFEAMSDEAKAQMHAYQEMGFMWEQVFTRVWRARQLSRRQRDNRSLLEQGEISICPHGVDLSVLACPHECGVSSLVFMTPDALDISDNTLEEYKCTWRSSNRIANFEEDFWEWLTQIKAYCFALKCLKARLFVFFVNNGYAPPKPRPRRLDMEFTPRDLLLNWNMLMQERSRLLAT